MMLVMAEGERVATPEEVRAAIAKGWRKWQPRLLRFGVSLARGDKARARDLVDRAVLSFLEPDGRTWPIDRVPSLERMLLAAIKSLWMRDCEAQANAFVLGGLAEETDEAPDSSQDIERRGARALHDEEVARVIARARELLEGDRCALAVLVVLEGDERDERVFQREARRTGQDPLEVLRLARRRMGRALQRAYEEVRKS